MESDYKGTINKEVISAKGTAMSETFTMSAELLVPVGYNNIIVCFYVLMHKDD